MTNSNKSKTENPILSSLNDSKQNSIFVERLMRLFELIEKSNEWKKNYEYFQRASDVTENSIRVSET